MSTKERCSRGSALLTALFIMTMVAIAATAMSMRLQLNVYRTQLMIDTDQLYLASQAVTYWSMDKLTQKHNASSTAKNTPFPKKLRHIHPNVKIEGRFVDLQGKFNLNNLADRKYQPMFFHLLKNTLPQSTSKQRKEIVRAIVQWINASQAKQKRRRRHQEIAGRLNQFPINQLNSKMMINKSELREIKGVSASFYEALAPFITALPEITPININTAAKPILMAMGNGLSDSQALEIIERRRTKKISQLNAIQPLLKKLNISAEHLTTESLYFLSIGETSKNELSLTNYTTLRRIKNKNKNKKDSVIIISERLNTN